RLRALLTEGRQAEVREAALELSLDPPRTVVERLPLARLLIDVDLARRAVAILKEERLDADARDVLALAYARTGDRVRARMLLDEQAADATESSLTHRVRGEMLLGELKWAEARAALNESLLRSPDDPFTLVLIAASHHYENDVVTEERILRDARRRFPHDPIVAGRLGELVLALRPTDAGSLAEVVRLLRQAAHRLPLNEGFRERLSVALMSLEDWREAVKVLVALTERWPENPAHWNRLGLVRGHLGDLEGAVEAFESATKCGTCEGMERYLIFLNLGNAQLQMADRTEERAKWGRAAWRTFQAAQTIVPQDARALIGMAKSTVETDPTGDQVHAAIQMYERAIELFKGGRYPPAVVHEAHLNVALLYTDLWVRDPEAESEGKRKALWHFEEAAKLVPPERWHPSARSAYDDLRSE
ncbi:MAG: tetratricopeptide repeat protein, partial [Planctomycetota bacterium]